MSQTSEEAGQPGVRGPWGAPPDESVRRPGRPRRGLAFAWGVCALVAAPTLISAYRDLSRPEAWSYWRDRYFAPSLTASLVPAGYRDAAGRDRPVLAVHGTIGAAAGPWLREAIASAHLTGGDAVALSSPGGNLDQALIMGEVIRANGLATIVGTVRGTPERIGPSYCASACVLAFAGGIVRLAQPGSRLGVHRFTTSGRGSDPVADTQRTEGRVIGYMLKMGVSPAIVEAMSATQDVRWLDPKTAADMALVTTTGEAAPPR